MTAPQKSSVIVVSHGRAALLQRCIAGLDTLFHRNFEVIVVADTPGIAALRQGGWLPLVKHAVFDEENISAARNIGLRLAAGEVVAFIDDDAVPEPSWLDRLTAPFADPGIAASGGYVLGRNGISYQWKARTLGQDGRAWPLELPSDRVSVLRGAPGQAIKLEGTNCAFRTRLLREMGGFDEAFRFYMDETDLCQRLAGRSAAVAIVPDALVHHGFAASRRRRADRVPLSLYEIGASTAVFSRLHARQDHLDAARRAMIAEQSARLRRFRRRGRLSARQARALLQGLHEGWKEGLARASQPGNFGTDAPPKGKYGAFGGVRKTATLAGWSWQAKKLLRQAELLANNRVLVTVMLMSPTSVFHQIRFDPRGFWLQEGGVFGRSERDQPLLRVIGFRARVREEQQRLSRWRLPQGTEPHRTEAD